MWKWFIEQVIFLIDWFVCFLRKQLTCEHLPDADNTYNKLTVIKGSKENQWDHVFHVIVCYELLPFWFENILILQKTTQKVIFWKLAA